MKTKNKMIAMVEIAIVLCSVFLVALPAITADQNQAVQKASASEVTTASEDDFVLEIYGNANEDDTIDMGDVVYTKLAIFGKKPKTELCDAKYDGRINVLDVIQTKLIILGKEKELTVIDSVDRIVTVNKPIKSIVVARPPFVEMVRSVGAKDRLIGVPSYKDNRYPRFFPELDELTNIGTHPIDCEVILDLNPDIVLMGDIGMYNPCCDVLEAADITVYRINPHPFKPPGGTPMDDYVGEIKKLGYMLDTEKEAEEFSAWFHGFMDKIKDRISELSDDEKPRGYFEYHRDYRTSAGTANMYCFEYAGVKNIFSDLSGSAEVDPEAVIVRDPEIIATCRGTVCNYEIDDPSEAKAIREAIMNRPGFDHVTAVQEGKVYIIPASFVPIYGGAPSHFFIGIAYMAKLFHPELFEDLDPEAIHQEYLTRFQRLDYDIDEWGVFVYPPFED